MVFGQKGQEGREWIAIGDGRVLSEKEMIETYELIKSGKPIKKKEDRLNRSTEELLLDP